MIYIRGIGTEEYVVDDRDCDLSLDSPKSATVKGPLVSSHRDSANGRYREAPSAIGYKILMACHEAEAGPVRLMSLSVVESTFHLACMCRHG